MMEQIKSSMNGGGNGGSGGGANGKRIYDAAIVGYGPAGGVMATLLAEKHGLRVCIIDPNPEKRWIPNYGVWVEEWESLDKDLQIGLGDCLDRTWEVTDSYFGGSHGVPADERCRIERPYARVSRDKMQANLKSRLAAAGVTKITGKVDAKTLEHSPEGTSVCLESGQRIDCRLLVDCSGHYSELVERVGEHNPGVQIAYGAEVEVKDGHAPYDENAMLFMDYRTDYVDKADLSAEEAKGLDEIPTFLYAMPMGTAPNGRKRIFFEETSLVARPPISFDLCKERLDRRLKHHGIEVTKVMDEELCYIPMGGAMPNLNQRVVAFGGASGLVHAATGYMHVRMLAASGPVSRAIAAELKKGGPGTSEAAARRAYQALWPSKAKLQRDFHVFGGEFLMAQQAPELRGFFNGFFKLPLPLWAGFLSGYPNLPHNELHQDWRSRFNFGLQFFFKLAPAVQFQLALAGALTGWQYGLIAAVTPLAEAEDAKDRLFDAEVDSIRAAATAKAEADDVAAAGAGAGTALRSTVGGRRKETGGDKNAAGWRDARIGTKRSPVPAGPGSVSAEPLGDAALCDIRYGQVKTEKEAARCEDRQATREALESRHLAEDKALCYASKADKEAGILKRAREKETSMAQLERDQMAYEDEDSRVRMALLSEKIQAMDAAQVAQLRQFNDPSFHFVPRQKMMQIQRCRKLQETKGGVQAIVTGMRECAENSLVQERGLKLVADTCLALESFGKAYVDAGILETIVDGMDRFRQDWHLQTCSCETISAIVAALPGSNRNLLARVLQVGAHRAVGRASRWHARSEDVLVAATQALETIALRCGRAGGGTENGRACVQSALLLSNENHAHHRDENDENEGALFEASTVSACYSGGAFRADTCDISASASNASGRSLTEADDGDVDTTTADRQEKLTVGGLARGGRCSEGMENSTRRHAEWERQDPEIGATSFALRLADSFSRDDSRTIVRRAGAARVAASALSLLRALLTDGGHRKKLGREVGTGGERDAETDDDEENGDDASLACCVKEFCDEQGVDIMISAMEHHIHDAALLLAGWQAMHSVICITRREQPLKAPPARETNHNASTTRRDTDDAAATGNNDLARDDAENTDGRGLVEDVAEALLRRNMNLEQLVSVLTRAMDLHLAVAPLQWICLVCLIDLHALDARVSDMFMIRSGCQILHRCIRINSRHTAVMEQGCRAVAVFSELSFTSRTRLFVEKIQDAIHQVVFLHRRHPGVYKLGHRALDALWGGDEFGAQQKASAEERLRGGKDDDDG
eukprot:g8177.t2